MPRKVTLPKPSSLRCFYLSYFSHPKGDRALYREIRRRPVQKILELGLGIGRRAVRMIEVASRYVPLEGIDYAGIDPFEARTASDGPGVTLKMAHRLLRSTGARIRLVPGEPFVGLANVANELSNVDLVVISAHQHPQSVAWAWFYLPRLLHRDARVFIERFGPDGISRQMQPIDRAEIERLARTGTPAAA